MRVFLDHTQTAQEGNQRSQVVLADILYDWETDGPYSQLWQVLHAAGKQVEAPERARLKLERDIP